MFWWLLSPMWLNQIVSNFQGLSRRGESTPERICQKSRGRHFRSSFFKNIDFGILTSTYAEFDPDHENDLLFGIWGFLKA